MKRDVRFLGIDDSPFRFVDPRVRVVGIVTRGPSYIEGVLSTWVQVDGEDATQRIADLVASTRFRPMLRAVFLNGVTMGGFNVVELDALHGSFGIPIVAIVRDEPDEAKVAAALKKHFPDHERRGRLLKRMKPMPVRNGRHTVWASFRGIDASAVPGLLAAATVRGAIPEPLRLAHVVASGIQRGESKGAA